MKIRLESITNIAVLITCGLITLSVVSSFATRPTSGRQQPIYQKGEQVQDFLNVPFDKAEKTLLLVLRKSCHFCTESMPFYRALTAQLAGTAESHRIQLVVVSLDELATAREYLAEQNLSIETVSSLSRERTTDFKIRGTPTLILANKFGIVEEVWTGLLNKVKQQEVLGALGCCEDLRTSLTGS